MAKEVSGDELLLGKGKVYFNRLVSAVGTGERFLGNVEAFELSPTDETLEKFSSATASAPLMKKALIRRKFSLRMVIDQFNKENFALALMGDNSVLAQGAGTQAPISVPGVLQGNYYKLPHRNITTATTIVTPDPVAAAWVLGTDYEMDLLTGRLYIIPGGGITDGDDLLVDYDYVADTSATVRAGVSSVIEGFVRFIGDPSTGPKWEVEVWKASVSPTGTISLIGDEFATAELTLEVLDDSETHPTEPYFRAILRT